ncbi:uncharacterized protein TRIADDRAFT_57414 [Trichoplax adhaerens]|uniref:Uncharacterized protein n=1 Tax=Trichoplax adhaerens TaxID=10228 RepID=B3RZD7_TRIAD|nr:predicted protein [Trichoplax adhaerens]EDV24183.1 predicted protein [Trichoplax adhaerens]|eukprot:XP_002113709.1 predicted protein [Trichoplax adhaerens]
MSAIKHAIASKFNDGYMEFMDKTWYSKAIHFKLDYHSPAYVNENLTVKSWSDASNNRINCQIMRDNDCLSTFSISFNPDLKYTPGILPLSLDVIHKDIFGIIFNGENFLSIRNRFNQPDISKFTNAAAEAFTTSLIYGVWNVSKFFSRSKGAMLLITSKFDIDPMFYTMQPDAPTKLKLGLESMGNKSFMSAYRIIDYQTKTVINKCENISVFVKDGKPEALPEQFKEELLQKVPVKALTEKPQPLFESIPQNHFTYHTKVRASDLDYNNHVGYGGVVGFCLDAASNAASSKSSAYRFDFGNDFNPSCIHQKFLLLRGQLLFDDEITVDTWQGYENNSLYFNVRKENKAVCQLEFIIDVQSIQKCN